MSEHLGLPLGQANRMFLADTALMGSLEGTKCGLEFFGVDHILFGTDSPFDPEKGTGYIRDTIRVIDALPIADTERQKIYEGNLRRLLISRDGNVRL